MGNTAKEINHLQEDPPKLQVLCGAKICATDLSKVVAALRIHLNIPHLSSTHPRVFHLDKLREESA